MSGNHKNTSAYSSSDLQKYGSGELSAREMHELEKAALEDPFLAEALEGMELRRTAISQDMTELQARLNNRLARKEDKKGVPFLRPWMKVAAAVILLLGLGSTAYFTLNHPAATALVTPPATATTPAAADSTAVVINNAPVPPAASARQASAPATQTIVPHRIRAMKEARRQDQDTARVASGATASASRHEEKREPALSVSKDTVEYQAALIARSATAKKAADEPAPGAVTVAPTRSRSSAGIFGFSGKVLDEHNHPLAGATVFLKGNSDLGTVTDKLGQFNLKVRPADSPLRLTVAYVGYEQASLALNTLNNENATGNIIRLQPQHASLDEVVVVGYGTKRKETLVETNPEGEEKIDTLWLRATPVNGRLQYEAYLETARKQLALDSTIKGTEIISFDINKKGELSSFKVEQSLSPVHDSSTIQLIREGPSWKLLRGRKVRAAVRVSF